jgi:hypothetical protein
MRQTANGGLLVAFFMLLGCGRPNISGLARKDEVCISPGEFVMGHDALPMVVKAAAFYNPAPTNDWAPAHSVALSDFCIEGP